VTSVLLSSGIGKEIQNRENAVVTFTSELLRFDTTPTLSNESGKDSGSLFKKRQNFGKN